MMKTTLSPTLSPKAEGANVASGFAKWMPR